MPENSDHPSGIRSTAEPQRAIPARRSWLKDPHFVLAAVAAVPVWIALGVLVGDRMRVSLTPMTIASFLLLQPVAEELAFRGALQGRLLRRGWTWQIGPVSAANLATTCLFVLAHLLVQSVSWAVAVAAPSLVFGYLRERFSSVLPPIAMHSLYNAGFALVAWTVQR